MKNLKNDKEEGNVEENKQENNEQEKNEGNDNFSYHVIDIEILWKDVSGFAIIEEVGRYLEAIDKKLEEISEGSIVTIVGKCPIWLYMIMSGRIQQTRSDIYLFYSKPTNVGHRRYKIYPW